MNLKEILLDKGKKQELGHFYILETSASEALATERLIQFVHEYIRDYYQQVEGHKQSLTHLMDHPDVFVLGNIQSEDEDKNDKPFKVEEAETLSRFFEFKPVQGKRKFAIITEGHRISTVVANKWLKLLEEPQGNSTIFLLNPRRGQLLPTIHSRAIHLRIHAPQSSKDFSEWNDLVQEASKMTLSQFLEKFSRNQNLSYWVNELVQWEAEKLEKPLTKQALENYLKDYQEMETFHQPTATKWTLFYSYLQTHVFPRL